MCIALGVTRRRRDLQAMANREAVELVSTIVATEELTPKSVQLLSRVGSIENSAR
jgi:hypothetical protein